MNSSTCSPVQIRLQLLRTDEGGRRGYIRTGYHGMVRFPENDEFNDCIVTSEGQEQCEPGAECLALLTFAAPDLVERFVTPGANFNLTEGARVVGRGEVIGVSGNRLPPVAQLD